MPHLIIEYTRDVFPGALARQILDAAHDALIRCGLFDEYNIKSRLHPLQDYRLHEDYHGFVAIQCRLHKGRSLTQRQQLSRELLAAVQGLVAAKTVVTVEMVEMERDCYSKSVG